MHLHLLFNLRYKYLIGHSLKHFHKIFWLFLGLCILNTPILSGQTYSFQFGNSGLNTLTFPFGIAKDASDNIYVVDQSAKKVLKFNSAGVFQMQIGAPGTNDGEFDQPNSVVVDAFGNIYVSDANLQRVEKFNSSGVFQMHIDGTSGTDPLLGPAGLAIDAAGDLWVVDNGDAFIKKYNTSTGAFISQFGGIFGLGDGEFSVPADIAIDSNGDIYITDSDLNRVQKFKSDGTYILDYGAVGNLDGEFNDPWGITIDGGDNVYVVDNGNDRVQKFAADGTFLAKFGTTGSSDGEFTFPNDAVISSTGLVYVTDGGNSRVQVFSVGDSNTEIKILGNGIEIVDGDNTPSSTDHTDFGNVTLGGSFVDKTYTIENQGISNLTINSINLSGTNATDFALHLPPTFPLTITAGNTATFTVRFTPSGANNRTAIINIANNDVDENPYTYNLKGNGVAPAPEIAVKGNNTDVNDEDNTPSATNHTDFEAANIGNTIDRTFTIQNSGNADLEIADIFINGTHATDFNIITDLSGLPITINPSASFNFTVRFTASTAGLRSAGIVIDNNDTDENPYNFAIQAEAQNLPAPEMIVKGNSQEIPDDNTTASVDDATDFGDVNVGSTLDKTYTIENTGNADLEITGISFTGTNAADFSLFPSITFPITITPSNSTTFTVRFTPSASGIRNAEVEIANNDADENPYNFVIKGNGQTPSAPEINVKGNNTTIADGDNTPNTADHTDFGDVIQGNTFDRTFTIENTGTASLRINGISFSGTNAPDFALVSPPTFPLDINASSSSTFTVRFTAGGLGNRSATIEIDNDDADENPYNFTIQGNGLPIPTPEINVKGNSNSITDGDNTPSTADHTDFGDVIQGNTFDRTFTIENTGNASLRINGISFSGTNAPDFALVSPPTFPLDINASSSSTFTVRFTAGGIGTRSAIVEIDNDDADENPYNFTIQGNGLPIPTPEINVKGNNNSITDGDNTPSTADHSDFGDVIVGNTLDRTFTIENTGNASLRINGISFSGTNAPDFALVSPPTFPLDINASSSSTFTVRFTAGGIGTRSAIVEIDNDDADENPYNFTIQGNGLPIPTPEINVKGNSNSITDGDNTPSTADHTDFGDVIQGNTFDRTFTIENTGNASLRINGISFSGTNAPDFALVSPPTFPLDINASSSSTFTVRFTAGGIGTRSAIVEIDNDDADEDPYNFTIQGNGLPIPTPEINVKGNNTSIADGDNTPNTADHTDFGDVIVGNTLDRTFTIENTGNADLTINSITLGGVNAAEFSLSGLPATPFNIASGDNQTFTVTFSPSSTNSKIAQVNINNNDSNENPYNFAIEGTGSLKTWDGGAGTNNWFDANNWSPNGVPTATDNLEIPAGFTIQIPSGTASAKFIFVNGTLQVANGATLNITGSTFNPALYVLGEVNNQGTINISNSQNSGLAVHNSGAVMTNEATGVIHINNVGLQGIALDGSFTNKGTISINNTGQVSNPANGIGFRSNGHTFDNQGDITIGTGVKQNAILFQSGSQFTNSGSIELNNDGGANDHGITGSGTFTNTGTVEFGAIGGNEIHTGATFINNAGGIIAQLSGTLNNAGILTNNGDFDLSFPFNNSGTFNNNGTLKGANTLTTSTAFVNVGTISPGNSPGILTINGDFTNNGTIDIEIAGNAGAGAANGHDRIVVNGTATLGGTVTVNLINGFTPTGSQVYNFLGATSRSGNFATVNFPTGTWTMSYSATGASANFGTPLPISLVKFNAQRINNEQVKLTWTTATEVNNKGFEIQQSEDGTSFDKIAWLDGAGNSNVNKNYQITVNNSKSAYYRLVQVDEGLNGKRTPSFVLYLASADAPLILQIFPNPTTERVQLSLGDGKEELMMWISNNQGQIVSQMKGNALELENHLNQILPQYAYGVMIVKIQARNQVFTKKLIKN